MIESIRLKNFQLYEDFTVEFDKYCTILVGPTDSGKSTVLRGLLWAATNKPPRGQILRIGASSKRSASVHVRTGDSSNGHTVVRSKGIRRNIFKLDGKQFSAVRREVPEEIGRVLNLSRSNFSMQLDSPLWFLLSPGQVSKELNSIVNLAQIDRVLALSSAEVREAKAEVKVNRARVISAQKECSKLAWIRHAKKDYAAIAQKQTELERLGFNLSNLRNLVWEGQKLIATVQRAVQAELTTKKAHSLALSGLKLEAELSSLTNLVKQAKWAKQASLNAVSKSAINELVSRTDKFINLQNSYDKVTNLVNTIREQQQCVLKYDQLNKKMQKRLGVIMKDRCPLCGKQTNPIKT